jgi:hypothetical protein
VLSHDDVHCFDCGGIIAVITCSKETFIFVCTYPTDTLQSKQEKVTIDMKLAVNVTAFAGVTPRGSGYQTSRPGRASCIGAR